MSPPEENLGNTLMRTPSDAPAVGISVKHIVLSWAVVTVAMSQVMAQRAYFYDRGPAPIKVDGVVIPSKEYGYYKTQWRRWPGTAERERTISPRSRATDLPAVEPRLDDEESLDASSSPSSRQSPNRTVPPATTSDSDSPPLPPADMDDGPPEFDFSRPPELTNPGVPGDDLPGPLPGTRPTRSSIQPPGAQPQNTQPPGATRPQSPALPSFDELFPNPTPKPPQGSENKTSIHKSHFHKSRLHKSRGPRVATALRSESSIAPDRTAEVFRVAVQQDNVLPTERAEMRFRAASRQFVDSKPIAKSLDSFKSGNPLRRVIPVSRELQPVRPVAHYVPAVETVKPTQQADTRQPSDERSNPLRRG